MVARVLVIEDDVELGSEIRDALGRRGIACETCTTIADAERALRRLRPDVVVSDVCLPDGDGVRFLHDYRAALPQTRWLLMSGNPGAGATEEARDLTILDKPVAWHTLIDFIRDARNDWSQ